MGDDDDENNRNFSSRHSSLRSVDSPQTPRMHPKRRRTIDDRNRAHCNRDANLDDDVDKDGKLIESTKLYIQS